MGSKVAVLATDVDFESENELEVKYHLKAGMLLNESLVLSLEWRGVGGEYIAFIIALLATVLTKRHGEEASMTGLGYTWAATGIWQLLKLQVVNLVSKANQEKTQSSLGSERRDNVKCKIYIIRQNINQNTAKSTKIYKNMRKLSKIYSNTKRRKLEQRSIENIQQNTSKIGEK